MPQAARLPETVKSAWLRWEVVEDTPHGRYVIAKFDTDADAERFVDCVGRRLKIRVDPDYAELLQRAREIRRSPEVHPAHEGVEP